jgi:peptidyl-prolyl cis-trans isomerase SurA
MMSIGARRLVSGILVLAMLAAILVAMAPQVSHATEIRYVVNGIPVTSYDIEKRMAFLRLQRKGGNARETATQEMIDQALRTVEMRRLGINVSDQAVEQAFANFARSNKMSVKQMEQIMAQSGVTSRHFKEFIRTQIGWNQALGARFRATGRLSEQDVVQRMLQQGGAKPSATEFMLQQVIFVVPASERAARLAARKREAEAMRNRFTGCSNTVEFARGLIDVTVRDLGRVLEPELPPDWAELIKATKAGEATRVRETERGVEFIGICSAREVSDDRVAQLVFQNESPVEDKAEELSKQYLDELKEKARIIER